MQVILRAGYRTEDLWQINRVRVLLQVLFMSDILTASGNMISSEVMSPRPRGEAWSSMRWPNKQPTMPDMDLWRNAIAQYAQAGAQVEALVGSSERHTASGNGTGIASQ
jgi:hypothetical protein